MPAGQSDPYDSIKEKGCLNGTISELLRIRLHFRQRCCRQFVKKRREHKNANPNRNNANDKSFTVNRVVFGGKKSGMLRSDKKVFYLDHEILGEFFPKIFFLFSNFFHNTIII